MSEWTSCDPPAKSMAPSAPTENSAVVIVIEDNDDEDADIEFVEQEEPPPGNERIEEDDASEAADVSFSFENGDDCQAPVTQDQDSQEVDMEIDELELGTSPDMLHDEEAIRKL